MDCRQLLPDNHPLSTQTPDPAGSVKKRVMTDGGNGTMGWLRGDGDYSTDWPPDVRQSCPPNECWDDRSLDGQDARSHQWGQADCHRWYRSRRLAPPTC